MITRKPAVSTAAERPAVDKANLLGNIAFLMYGSRSADAKRKLRGEMIAHREVKGNLSRQGVAAWFDSNSTPSKRPALEFVQDFFETKIPYDTLTEERKKSVYARIQAFFRQVAESGNPDNKARQDEEVIYTTKSGVLIRYKTELSDIADLEKALGGFFLAYRYRFNEDDQQRPIARDVAHIFRQENELRFDLWYRREDAGIDRFRGVILSVGHLLWFLGATEKPPPRLRIMHFLHTKTPNEKHNSLWWGIASSNIPSSEPDPVSARVCLVKQRRQMDGPIERLASYLTIVEFRKERHANFLERLINNRQTALSKGHTMTPQEIEDRVLRVYQATAERTSDNMFSDFNWAKNAEGRPSDET